MLLRLWVLKDMRKQANQIPPLQNRATQIQQHMDSLQQLGFDPPSVSMMLARVGLMLIIEAVHMRARDAPFSNQPPNNEFLSFLL